jgi:hypothetical protein
VGCCSSSSRLSPHHQAIFNHVIYTHTPFKVSWLERERKKGAKIVDDEREKEKKKKWVIMMNDDDYKTGCASALVRYTHTSLGHHQIPFK